MDFPSHETRAGSKEGAISAEWRPGRGPGVDLAVKWERRCCLQPLSHAMRCGGACDAIYARQGRCRVGREGAERAVGKVQGRTCTFWEGAGQSRSGVPSSANRQTISISSN